VTRASEWATRVAAWRASGKTSKQFCKEGGYSARSLLWWSSEFNRRPAAPSRHNPVALTRVIRKREPRAVGADAPIVVRFEGVGVEVPMGADRTTLTMVLGVLGARTNVGGKP
jgi:hypothetical protein